MSKYKVGFIGAGVMGGALIKGMIDSELLSPRDIIACDKLEDKLAETKKELGIDITTLVSEVVKNSSIIFLAIKPQDMADILAEIKKDIDSKSLIVSIAAGISISYIAARIPSKVPVIRMMPNTPCLAKEGMMAIAIGDTSSKEDFIKVEKLVNPLGKVIQVEERQMDAVTALSGSGPGYVMLMIEALAEGGVLAGLPRNIALDLATQTVLGSAKLLQDSGEHPAKLKDMVSSPAGTTIYGLAEMESLGVRTGIVKGVLKAAERSKELG